MKLLFDHNLAPSLVRRLTDLFPESEHVFNVGLSESTDIEIREYAYESQLIIVTKDVDFSDLCVMRGFPPKVVWIRRGNCSVESMESLLREHYDEISVFDEDPVNGVLTLF